MNIRVDLNTPIFDGTEVVFRSPVDCSQVTGLKVYYDGGSQEFAFADAHGNNVGDIDHLFAENVVVKVILDVTTGMAFVQNADTNAYLEGRFNGLSDSIVCKSSGEIVAITDSTNRPLQGLTLCGKTTQNGAPTPSAPVALESAGSSGSIAVSITGKNLFGGEAFADRMVELGATKDATAETILYAPGSCIRTEPIFNNFKENTRYTIVLTGWNTMATTGTNIMNIIVKYADGKAVYVDGKALLNTEETVIYTTDANNTVAHFGIAHADGMTTLRYNKCGIFEGVITLDEFEPYKQAQTLTVSTPNGLPGIPVTSGGNYTDQKGQQWVCDEIDLAKGVYVQRTVLLENFTKWQANTATDTYRFKHNANLIGGAKLAAICTVMGKESYIFSTADTVHYYIDTDWNVALVYVPTGFDNSNNVIKVLVALETPIETPLADIPDYTQLHTHYPNTTVMADGAGVAVTYVADTKHYIDNKFTELQNAILAAGANV